jgi:hypothetical protein
MLTLCWSPKGGSGTTVVAAALALVSAHREPTLLLDLGGDVPAALGSTVHAEPGVFDWLDAPHAEAVRLHGLAQEAAPHLWLAPLGRTRRPLDDGDVARLIDAGRGWRGATVMDLGASTVPSTAWRDPLVTSLAVVRSCYLTMQRLSGVSSRADALVFVEEPKRAVSAHQVSNSLGLPIVAVVPWDPNVARSVDSGMLRSRMPAALSRALEPLGAARDAA